MARSMVEKVESMRGKINKRYSLSTDQITELSKHYSGRVEYGFATFLFGYMQGMKAAKAELKKDKAV